MKLVILHDSTCFHPTSLWAVSRHFIVLPCLLCRSPLPHCLWSKVISHSTLTFAYCLNPWVPLVELRCLGSLAVGSALCWWEWGWTWCIVWQYALRRGECERVRMRGVGKSEEWDMTHTAHNCLIELKRVWSVLSWMIVRPIHHSTQNICFFGWSVIFYFHPFDKHCSTVRRNPYIFWRLLRWNRMGWQNPHFAPDPWGYKCNGMEFTPRPHIWTGSGLKWKLPRWQVSSWWNCRNPYKDKRGNLGGASAPKVPPSEQIVVGTESSIPAKERGKETTLRGEAACGCHGEWQLLCNAWLRGLLQAIDTHTHVCCTA